MKKIKQAVRYRSILLHVLGAVAWVMLIFAGTHHAISADSFIQSYGTSSTLQEGIVVQLDPSNSQNVVVASKISQLKFSEL